MQRYKRLINKLETTMRLDLGLTGASRELDPLSSPEQMACDDPAA